jgi:SAM-dependent methyltransferase
MIHSHWCLVTGLDGTTWPLVSQTGSRPYQRGTALSCVAVKQVELQRLLCGRWMKTLVLGCGLKKPDESIGIDMNPETTADILYDLNRTPYPLKADYFERIICHDIIEHLDNIIAVMQEIHRIGAPGALVDIKTPHFSSILSWNDPTHKHHFSRTSFEYFTNAPDRWRTQFYTREKFAALKQEITFTRAPPSRLGQYLYSLSPRLYEHHFAWIFPAKGLHVVLQILK